MQEMWVRSLLQEDPLEKEMAIHCSIVTWRIPWTGKPSVLQSMGWQRVGRDLATEQQQNYHQEFSLSVAQVTVQVPTGRTGMEHSPPYILVDGTGLVGGEMWPKNSH
ncbi:unnamed protein product [Rangifer tarandus platyrhynchus]|uniref:Uncharacterized protein n=1 Tax=Rangifer tarandus platyrhynchus TaxID=3082113 RepID=A0ABN8ZIM7_RANTA|nr:unnamed protein product [Rangifer tarandus platyrhynchus]